MDRAIHWSCDVHVTGDDLRAYIEVFHQSLHAAALQYLPPSHESILLRHTSMLPSRISAYVSSQFGLAIEYEPAATTSIQVHTGPDRVEDLLLRTPGWVREVAPMFTIDGPNYSLRKRPLTRGYPFRLTSERAALTLEEVSIQLGPWKRFIAYAEVHGRLEGGDWTVEKAHSRARSEVLLGLVRLRQAAARQLSVTKYLEQFQEKIVLLLGEENEAGRARLARMSESLRSFGYEPLCLADIPGQPAQTMLESIATLAAEARFVLVDESRAAQARLDLCRDHGWLAVPLNPGEPEAAVLPALRRAEAAREELEGRMRG
jgi:hypothetical protein